MSRRKILSNATQLAARTLIVMAAAGLVITFVYLPVRWTGTSQKAFEREEAFRQRMPPQYRERADRERQMIRRRPAPAFEGARLMLSQFIGIAIFAWIGRRVFRLRLKR